MVPVLLFVSFVTFGLVRLAPGDPVTIVLGGRRVDPATADVLRQQFGLVGDPFTQYISWLGRALQGDLGDSYRLRQDVVGLIAQRLPITLELIVLSMLIAVAVAIPLGVIQAHRRDSPVDYGGSLLALIGLSSPVYFTAVETERLDERGKTLPSTRYAAPASAPPLSLPHAPTRRSP